MYFKFLLIVLRLIERQKFYFTVNIVGLALSMATSMLIALYVVDEFSYDNFHPQAERIYRLAQFAREKDGLENSYCRTGGLIAETFCKELPEVESMTRVKPWDNVTVASAEKNFYSGKTFLADSNFFEFFGYKLVLGNPKNALDGRDKIVLTVSAAEALFGYKSSQDNSPIGKQVFLKSHSDSPMLVSGIVEDPPAQSHFHFKMLITSANGSAAYSWTDLECYNYFKLTPETTVETFESKLPYFYEKYVVPEFAKFGNTSYRIGEDIYFFTQPLKNIHLDSHLVGELEDNGHREYLHILIAIAVLIILLGCVNFINLATARASIRAKEVGIRKTAGASNMVLFNQFMSESLIFVLLSFCLALGMISASLNSFNVLTGKTISLENLMELKFLTGIGVGILVVVFLAGAYPSLYLTSLNPRNAFKTCKFPGDKTVIRNSLVTFQFVISIVLIVLTINIYRQVDFLQKKKPGNGERTSIVREKHNQPYEQL